MMRMELAQAQATGESWQGVVTLFVLLLVFGYMGWRRGLVRELIVFFAILFGQLIRSSDVGPGLVNAINRTWALFKLGISSGFSPQKMMARADQLKQMKPFIPPERQEAFLFLLFIGIIFLGYYLGRYVSSSRPSPISMLMGMVNGYLIGSLVLPLLPRQLPTALPGQELSEPQRKQAQEFLHRGIQQLSQVLGIEPAYLVLLIVGLLIIWAALELR